MSVCVCVCECRFRDFGSVRNHIINDSVGRVSGRSTVSGRPPSGWYYVTRRLRCSSLAGFGLGSCRSAGGWGGRRLADYPPPGWALQLQLGAHLSNVAVVPAQAAAHVALTMGARARSANGRQRRPTTTPGKRKPTSSTHTLDTYTRRPHMHNSQCVREGGGGAIVGAPASASSVRAAPNGTTADLINQKVSHRYSFGH